MDQFQQPAFYKELLMDALYFWAQGYKLPVT